MREVTGERTDRQSGEKGWVGGVRGRDGQKEGARRGGMGPWTE